MTKAIYLQEILFSLNQHKSCLMVSSDKRQRDLRALHRNFTTAAEDSNALYPPMEVRTVCGPQPNRRSITETITTPRYGCLALNNIFVHTQDMEMAPFSYSIPSGSANPKT